VLDVPHLPVADHHVGAVGCDRLDQPGDVRGAVLAVGVGVDDHVGAQLQSGVETRLERRREPAVTGQPYQVIDAVAPRHLHRAVGRAIVDHEPFDLIEARHLARQVR
jgi:hypothetical protein